MKYDLTSLSPCEPVCDLGDRDSGQAGVCKFVAQVGDNILVYNNLGVFFVDGVEMCDVTEVADADAARLLLLADNGGEDEVSGGIEVPEVAASSQDRVGTAAPAASEEVPSRSGDDETRAITGVYSNVALLAGRFDKVQLLLHTQESEMIAKDGTHIGYSCDMVLAVDFQVLWLKLYRR